MTPTVPRRALIVSAGLGQGHHAAGRALHEAMARVWPDCQVCWLDAVAAMGPGFARLAQGFYISQVRHLPWMYEFFFSAMRRHHWYLESTRRSTGWWFGRRMGPRIRALDPDVIVSTYPLGSAGLSWLRRHRQLSTPIGAWVPAFCPHPSWLYPDLDITFVMHPAAATVAARLSPACVLPSALCRSGTPCPPGPGHRQDRARPGCRPVHRGTMHRLAGVRPGWDAP